MTTTCNLCPLHSAQRELSPEQRFQQAFVTGTVPTALEVAQQYLYYCTRFSPPSLPTSRVSSQSASINPLLYQFSRDPNVFVQQLPSAMHIDNKPESARGNTANNVEAHESSNPSRSYSFMPKYTVHHHQQYPRQFRSNVQPRFSPPFVNIQIQFPTPPPYTPPLYTPPLYTPPLYTPPRLSRDTIEDDPIVISKDDAPVSECDETQEITKLEGESSSTADLVTFDYVIDDTSQEQPVENSEQTLPLSRPPYSNSALIRMAIMSSPNKQLGRRGIYNAISSMFPYFEKRKRAWKNTMRHCLNTSKCFKKVEGDGLRNNWMVDENSGENFMKGSFRKSKVPRKRPYVAQIPRLAPNTVSSGVPKDWSLDSMWLLNANELETKTIPNPHVHILELLPPDSPQGSSECFRTYI